MPLVLIVEDDAIIARTISAHLRQAGMDVEWAADGELGLRRLRFGRPDACVIDLMLPTLDGWSLTARARAEGLEMPILIVSARASEADKVRALEIGADDYLAKPFGMAELVARVQAALRRSASARPTAAPRAGRVPGLLIDPDQQRALAGGRGLGRRAGPAAHAHGVPPALDAGREPGPGDDPRRPPAARVGRPLPAARPLGRRLRQEAAGEARPSSPFAYVHTHYGIGYRFAAEPVDENAPAVEEAEALAEGSSEHDRAEHAAAG